MMAIASAVETILFFIWRGPPAAACLRDAPATLSARRKSSIAGLARRPSVRAHARSREFRSTPRAMSGGDTTAFHFHDGLRTEQIGILAAQDENGALHLFHTRHKVTSRYMGRENWVTICGS
jgi:hypothetical protein